MFYGHSSNHECSYFYSSALLNTSAWLFMLCVFFLLFLFWSLLFPVIVYHYDIFQYQFSYQIIKTFKRGNSSFTSIPATAVGLLTSVSFYKKRGLRYA